VRTCKKKHNTLLHLPGETRGTGDPQTDGSSSGDSPQIAGGSASVVAHGAIGRRSADVLLSTALVYVYGSRIACRALLDSGSQVNFISQKCIEALKLKTRPVNISISGIGGAMSVSNQIVRIRLLSSRLSSFEDELECVVTKQITDKVPASTLKRRAFRLPPGIDLADPNFNVSSDVDLLIGAELF
jgi:hypothetical protein